MLQIHRYKKKFNATFYSPMRNDQNTQKQKRKTTVDEDEKKEENPWLCVVANWDMKGSKGRER